VTGISVRRMRSVKADGAGWSGKIGEVEMTVPMVMAAKEEKPEATGLARPV